MINYTIRNFVVISHIDHGKSTLADRFLELTHTITSAEMHPQYLDSMSLEKEKGITIKMHPCRMIWPLPRDLKEKLQAENCVLNLIDTPGHIDFSYETSRALAAVEGALLLVDATKGVQAQTLFNLEMARQQGLEIIGLVNKIDVKIARVAETKKELSSFLKVDEDSLIEISAKYGWNIEKVLRTLVEKIPPPQNLIQENFRALVFDSKYNPFFGIIAFVRVFDGEIRQGEKIYFLKACKEGEVKEIGYFSPQFSKTDKLSAGEIGYIKTGIKNANEVKIGDTIIRKQDSETKKKMILQPLKGYVEPQAVLFLSLYPSDPSEFPNLEKSLLKLKLNDAALSFKEESKMSLGRGFRCGFLGSLHAEISIRRLKMEFAQSLIITAPQVVFRIVKKNGQEIYLTSPSAWPDDLEIKEIFEPWVEVQIITPQRHLEKLFKLMVNIGAEIKNTNFLSSQKFIIKAQVPLREIIRADFYNKLKGSSEGYASFSFKPIGFRKANLVKLDILIAGQKENALARIIPANKTFEEAKKILKKLKELIPPRQFDLVLQGAVRERIIARETIRSRRKDVTAPLYGGDVTRKKKLLEIQKKGKKKLKNRGQFTIPPKVFLEMFRSSD